MAIVYEVNSCGVSVTLTHSKIEAYNAFKSSDGPEVKLLEIPSEGIPKLLQHKIKKFATAHSKSEKPKKPEPIEGVDAPLE